ncbi:MAG: DUF2946 family protein [Methylocystis sp.]
MLSRHLVKLLFCIALLAQIAAPVAGAGAMAAGRGGAGVAFCDPSLGAHSASIGDPSHSPSEKHRHHAACAMCPVAGVAPLTSAIAWAQPNSAPWSHVALDGSARDFIPEIFNHSASPRAPPSLV